MTTELAHRPDVDAAALERVIAEGDLKALSSEMRVAYYRARCEAAGLDPRTQPFQYLTLNGKLVLYATKAASDQLISGRNLDVQLGTRTFDADSCVAEQTCRVRRPDGSIVEDLAAVHLGSLKGEALANALMKLVTKAKRRTVLSACGLGMLDESEIDSIPGARREPMPPMESLRPDAPPADALPAWADDSPPVPTEALPIVGPAGAVDWLRRITNCESVEQLDGLRAELIAAQGAGRAPKGAAGVAVKKTLDARRSELGGGPTP